MLNLVVKILFKLISIIVGVVLTPIIAIISPIMSVFGFSEFIPYILQFLNTAFTYFNFFVVAFHIPIAPLILIISICGVLITFNISMRAVLMVMSVYSTYKSGAQSSK